MEAKLYKVENTFYLKVGETILGTSSNPNLSASIRYSLSLKNCQEIENGYDLNELAKEYAKQEFYDWGGEIYEQTFLDTKYLAFKEGFQKAFEILGDKKFTKEDMCTMMLKSAEWVNDGGEIDANKLLNDTIQSLQQTEWDCIVETTCDGMVTGLCMPEVCDCNIIPKLDADGCLILRKI